MPATPSSLFKSVSWRVQQMQRLAETGGPGIFRDPLTYKAEEIACLELADAPVPHPTAKRELIYSREATRAYVILVSSTLYPEVPPVVVKLFAITSRHSRPAQASRELLEDSEVEVRYLKILSMMVMAHGGADACALAVGYRILTRQQVEACGYMPDDRSLFAEDRRRSRSTGQYALIIAEAGDSSVTTLTTSLLRERGLSSYEMTYQLASVCFQLCHLLAVVHTRFPSFRHNDLHCSNLLVQNIPVRALRSSLGLPDATPLVVEYCFGDRRWQVNLDRAPFRVLLWDLAYSSISGEDAEAAGLLRVVPRVRECGSAAIVSKTSKNTYVDIFKFIDTLRWVADSSVDASVMAKLAPDLLDFLRTDVAPPDLQYAAMDSTKQREAVRDRQLRVHARADMLGCPSPTSLLLTHPLFSRLFEMSAGAKRPKPAYRLGLTGLQRDASPPPLSE